MLYPWQVALTLAAGCVMLIMALASLRQRRMLVVPPFSAVCALAAIWCFVYGWQLPLSSLEEKLLAVKLGFTVIPFMPLLTLEITYRFVYERRLLRGWLLLAALVVPVITAVLGWTINDSTIFRYGFRIDADGGLPLLRFHQGPWSFVFYFYTYALALWSFAILIGSLRTARPWERRAVIAFLIARLCPLIFDFLSHFHVLPPHGMNYAPASFVVAGTLMCFIFFGDRLGYRAYVAHSKLVEKVSDLLIVLDSRRRVLDMNHAATGVLGVPLKAAQGRPAAEVFGSWHALCAHLHDLPPAMVEVERAGEWYELTVIPLQEGAREGVFILWLRNVTRRKQAEMSYRAAADAARQATEAKDRYLAVMSHEIRNPMNSVLGFIRLLEQTPLDAGQQEYIGHLASSSAGLLAVLNEVLDFSKIEAGAIQLASEPFDLRREIYALCRGLKVDAVARGLAFDCRIAPEVPHILVGDPRRVSQILRNLVSNAVKFTASGRVDVRIDCPERLDGGCLLRIAVQDTGIGISPRELTALFQPFSQATPSIQHQYGGTGLGLVIARRISELMGGTISVESTPGRGSTFTCLLRLGLGEGLTLSGTAEPPPAPVRPLRILVVDDQQVNRRLLQIMLTRMGHEVVLAPDGFDALALIRRDAFDVLILDIEMPGIDGFEVARRIRGEFPARPFSPHIVALTAHASAHIREQCFAAGMDGYLSKPLTVPALTEALATASAARRA